MRFKFTIFLLVANIALFAAIWELERDASSGAPERRAMAPITVLEIGGKSVEKPRVLKLENNRWRIVSPIDWPANLFAVNRIINQLEFLEKETGFQAAEALKRGHGLAEYGLDDPAYVFKYGNGEKMYSLKVGKGAPRGQQDIPVRFPFGQDSGGGQGICRRVDCGYGAPAKPARVRHTAL